MKFYAVVVILSLVVLVSVTLIVNKTKSNACGCSRKFEEIYTESEISVERLG